MRRALGGAEAARDADGARGRRGDAQRPSDFPGTMRLLTKKRNFSAG